MYARTIRVLLMLVVAMICLAAHKLSWWRCARFAVFDLALAAECGLVWCEFPLTRTQARSEEIDVRIYKRERYNGFEPVGGFWRSGSKYLAASPTRIHAIPQQKQDWRFKVSGALMGGFGWLYDPGWYGPSRESRPKLRLMVPIWFAITGGSLVVAMTAKARFKIRSLLLATGVAAAILWWITLPV